MANGLEKGNGVWEVPLLDQLRVGAIFDEALQTLLQQGLGCGIAFTHGKGDVSIRFELSANRFEHAGFFGKQGDGARRNRWRRGTS